MQHNNLVSLIKVLFSAVALLLLALIISRVYVPIEESPHYLTLQSRVMLKNSESLSSAIRPSVWPPGYTLLLFAARKFDIPLQYVNLGLFYLTIALLYIVAKKCSQNIPPFWLPLSYAFCAFNYYNLAEFTSEAVDVPLSLLTLLFLETYQRRRTFTSILCLSICCSLLFVSRYQTVIWLTPIIAYYLVFTFRTASLRHAALWHSTSFFVIAFSPLALLMASNLHQTGYLTGMERFDWSSRPVHGKVGYFATSTGFNENVLLTAKTYFLDFDSPVEFATHEANHLQHSISNIEMGVIGLFILAMVLFFLNLIRFIRTHEGISSTLNIWRHTSPITLIAAQYLVGYIIVTILIWTVGNNDPLYSRFLYPSYVYSIIGLFSAYSFLKRESASRTSRLPFLLLLLCLTAISLYKLYNYHAWYYD